MNMILVADSFDIIWQTGILGDDMTAVRVYTIKRIYAAFELAPQPNLAGAVSH